VRSPQADRRCEIPAENAGTVEGQAVEEVFGRNGEEGSEVRTVSLEVIITLPTGEVICRQIKRDVIVGKGHCPKLAAIRTLRAAKAEIKAGIKVEVIAP